METTNDPLGLYAVINAAFPGALIKYCDNFDDAWYGWDICPLPGVLIRFNVALNRECRIKIEKTAVIDYFKQVSSKEIFKGDIPAGDDGPDLDFIKKVLINWASF